MLRPSGLSEPEPENVEKNSTARGLLGSCCRRDKKKEKTSTTSEASIQGSQSFSRASGLDDDQTASSPRKSSVLQRARESLRALVEQVHDDRTELASVLRQTVETKHGSEASRTDIWGHLSGLSRGKSAKSSSSQAGRIKGAPSCSSPESIRDMKEHLRLLIDDFQHENTELNALLQQVLVANAANRFATVQRQTSASKTSAGPRTEPAPNAPVPDRMFSALTKSIQSSAPSSSTESQKLETAFSSPRAVNTASGMLREDPPPPTTTEDRKLSAGSAEGRALRYQEGRSAENLNGKTSLGRGDIALLGQDLQSLLNEIRAGYQRIRQVVEEACLTGFQRPDCSQIQTKRSQQTLATKSQSIHESSAKGPQTKKTGALSTERSLADKSSQVEVSYAQRKAEETANRLTVPPVRTDVKDIECWANYDQGRPPSIAVVTVEAPVIPASIEATVTVDRRSVANLTEADLPPGSQLALEQLQPPGPPLEESGRTSSSSSKQVAVMTEPDTTAKPSKFSTLISSCSSKWRDTKQSILASLRGRPAPEPLPAPPQDGSYNELGDNEPLTAAADVAPNFATASKAPLAKGLKPPLKCLSRGGPSAAQAASIDSERSVTPLDGTPTTGLSTTDSSDAGEGGGSLASLPDGVLDQDSISQARKPARSRPNSTAARAGVGESLTRRVSSRRSSSINKSENDKMTNSPFGSMPDGVLDENSIRQARRSVKKTSSASIQGPMLLRRPSQRSSSREKGAQASVTDSSTGLIPLGEHNPSETLMTTTLPSPRASAEDATSSEAPDSHQQQPPDAAPTGLRKQSLLSIRPSNASRRIPTSPTSYVLEAEGADLSAVDGSSSASRDSAVGRSSRSSLRLQPGPTEFLAVDASLERQEEDKGPTRSPSLLSPPGSYPVAPDVVGKRSSTELATQRTSESRTQVPLPALDSQPELGGYVDEMVMGTKTDITKEENGEVVFRSSLRSNRSSQTARARVSISSVRADSRPELGGYVDGEIGERRRDDKPKEDEVVLRSSLRSNRSSQTAGSRVSSPSGRADSRPELGGYVDEAASELKTDKPRKENEEAGLLSSPRSTRSSQTARSRVSSPSVRAGSRAESGGHMEESISEGTTEKSKTDSDAVLRPSPRGRRSSQIAGSRASSPSGRVTGSRPKPAIRRGPDNKLSATTTTTTTNEDDNDDDDYTYDDKATGRRRLKRTQSKAGSGRSKVSRKQEDFRGFSQPLIPLITGPLEEEEEESSVCPGSFRQPKPVSPPYYQNNPLCFEPPPSANVPVRRPPRCSHGATVHVTPKAPPACHERGVEHLSVCPAAPGRRPRHPRRTLKRSSY